MRKTVIPSRRRGISGTLICHSERNEESAQTSRWSPLAAQGVTNLDIAEPPRYARGDRVFFVAVNLAFQVEGEAIEVRHKAKLHALGQTAQANVRQAKVGCAG